MVVVITVVNILHVKESERLTARGTVVVTVELYCRVIVIVLEVYDSEAYLVLVSQLVVQVKGIEN